MPPLTYEVVTTAVTLPLAPEPMSGQAATDHQVLELWLHGRSPHTIRAYRHDIRRFLAFTALPLAAIRLSDLQAFADSLVALAQVSRGRRLAAVKSLLAFAHKIGYLAWNVGVALELPPVEDKLAQRIMTEGEVLRMIHGEKGARNHAMLRLLYVSGVRVSELCGLCWRHVQPNEQGGQITVFGKGRKTRAIRLTATAWEALGNLRRDTAAPDDPVFRSRLGGALDPSQVRRIVYAAAQRAGLEQKVSPHWFRHAHASHALDRGAPIHLVQATLGHGSVATTGRYLHARPSESSGKFLAD